ncbi:MAG: hypothetical protein H5T98_11410 [Syntrophomonadaceae bacterium]|nr:hypothetical protein [Syntrophomonadaceae bacterium]
MATALDELKLRIEHNISPDDVIMGILSGLDEDTISKDPGIFHQAIYELKKKDAYNELLQEFEFDISGLAPFSDLLDRVLFRLETSNILGTLNPRYAMYELQKEQLKQGFNKFSDEQKELLLKMSQEFASLVNS